LPLKDKYEGMEQPGAVCRERTVSGATAARWIDAHWIVHEIPKNIKIDLP